jgi:SAM-dependent methyltransferase
VSLQQLKKLRHFELNAILERLEKAAPKGARILDIGAGTGWQAHIVTGAGYAVEAIDLTTSTYVDDRVFPIRNYDGYRIPFSNHSFDVIYSSNVLEHVAHAKEFQKEIHRVLKPDGVVIHVVPSGSWRFWSNLAHYPYIAKRVFVRLFGKQPTMEPADSNEPNTKQERSVLARVFIPRRDGEIGNALTEIYHFSRWRWRTLFSSTDWKVGSRESNRLFYTAYYTFGVKLSITARSLLSYFLGGSCHIFVLRPSSSTKVAPQEYI